MFLVKFLEIWLLLETGDYSDGGTCLKLLCAHPPPLSAGGEGGVAGLPTKFSKKGELGRTSTFRGGLLGKRRLTFSGEDGGLQFSHKK